MSDLFFNAVKNKYRFPSKRGNLTAEQLFDLSFESLDEIYGELTAQLDEVPKKSLLVQRSNKDDELREKADIVEAVFAYKADQRNKAKDLEEKRQQKQKLLELLEKKKDKALEDLSEEEILKKLAELEDR